MAKYSQNRITRDLDALKNSRIGSEEVIYSNFWSTGSPASLDPNVAVADPCVNGLLTVIDSPGNLRARYVIAYVRNNGASADLTLGGGLYEMEDRKPVVDLNNFQTRNWRLVKQFTKDVTGFVVSGASATAYDLFCFQFDRELILPSHNVYGICLFSRAGSEDAQLASVSGTTTARANDGIGLSAPGLAGSGPLLNVPASFTYNTRASSTAALRLFSEKGLASLPFPNLEF